MKMGIQTSFLWRTGARLLLGVLAFNVVASAPASAQGYPTKSIHLILPYPPGGGTDIVARLVANKLQQRLGQPVVVENKPGASTIIGTEVVAKSPPDGYTVGLITDSHVLNPFVSARLPYDSVKDFQPVSQLASVPLVLISNPKLNIKTIDDLVNLSKAKPQSLSYASIGDGTPHHLAMELLKKMAKINPLHVPYRGVGPALNDVVGGQVDLMFTGTSTAKPFIDSGKLVPLAVSSAKRQSIFPEVPTIAESGVKGYEFVTWYGLVTPARTPPLIVNRLSQEVAVALAQQDVKDRLAALGVVPVSSTPTEFASFLTRETATVERILKETGVKLQ